jgi:O-antigen ligase
VKRKNDPRRPPAQPLPIGQWALIVALVTLPALFFLPGAKENFRLPKLLLSEGLGLASLVILAFRARRGAFDPRRLLGQPAVTALLPFLAVASFGLLVSSHPHHVRQGLTSLWIGAACVVGWSLACTAAERRSALRALTLPAVVLSLIAVGQFHGLMPQFQFQDYVKDRIAITSVAGGPFDLAGYLVLPMLIAQVGILRASRPRWRAGWGLVLVLGLYVMALTQTLSAIAALLAASLVLWLGLLPWRRVAAVTALVVLLGGGLAAGVGPLRERILAKSGNLTAGDVNHLLSGRLDGWWAALWMFRGHPLTGVGHGAYRAEFGTARLALWDEGRRFYRRQHQTYFSNAHSEPLEVLAESGVPGVLALGWGLWLVARRLRRKSRAPDGGDAEPAFERTEAALMWAGLTAMAVLSAAYFPMRIALVAYPYLLLTSHVLAPAEDETPAGSSGKAGRAWILILVLLAATVLYLRYAEGRLRASFQLAAVEQMTVQLAQQGAFARRPLPPQVRRLLESGASGLLEAGERDPVEFGIPMARGSLFYLLGRSGAAVRAYEEALALEARSEIYANLGRVYFTAGDRDAAREAFRKAQRLDHNVNKKYRGFVDPLGLRERGQDRDDEEDEEEPSP